MSKNMKTIKFGENGTVYAVNDCSVKVEGSLSANSNKIDFGTFEEGLTELCVITKGVADTNGDYYHVGINGIETGFVTSHDMYVSTYGLEIRKVGDLWFAKTNQQGNLAPYVIGLLNDNNIDKIESFYFRAYDNSTFSAGHKYALEGR